MAHWNRHAETLFKFRKKNHFEKVGSSMNECLVLVATNIARPVSFCRIGPYLPIVRLSHANRPATRQTHRAVWCVNQVHHLTVHFYLYTRRDSSAATNKWWAPRTIRPKLVAKVPFGLLIFFFFLVFLFAGMEPFPSTCGAMRNWGWMWNGERSYEVMWHTKPYPPVPAFGEWGWCEWQMVCGGDGDWGYASCPRFMRVDHLCDLFT